jgi:outer membrane biogenesis lipoprotein LolB
MKPITEIEFIFYYTLAGIFAFLAGCFWEKLKPTEAQKMAKWWENREKRHQQIRKYQMQKKPKI